MIGARRHGRLVALSFAAVGCFDDPLPGPDASLEDAAAAPDDLGPDASPGDLPAAAPDAPLRDAEPFDAADAAAAEAGPRCARAADCDGGRVCGPSGACVGCLPADDRCPVAQRCDPATLECVPGCDARRPCATGDACCDGRCVDVRTAVDHCGACGRRCDVRNGVAACAAGVCGVAACAAGFADCDRAADNGCEAALGSDPARCGACDVSCPTPPGAAGAACEAGRCGFTCGGSLADCDGSADNGCEVDTRTSAAHCGACGRPCAAAPNATTACAAGVCAARCSPSYADCDGMATNGCEVDTRTSVLHCGACGRQCAAPSGIPGCAAGACVVSGCMTGRGNCDGLVANGCETDLTTSPTHCGACGAAAREVCDGRDNSCDGRVDNGCPTAVGGLTTFDATSPEYGGAAGTAQAATCPSGQVVRGVFGKVNSTVITELSVVCGAPELVEDRTVTPYRYAVTLAGSTDVGYIGLAPAAGTAFRYVCPGSSVVTRIAGHASPYVYRLAVECSTLTVTGAPGSLRVTATSVGLSPSYGSTNGAAFDYRCPADAAGSASALRGLTGHSTRILTTLSFVSSVGARCGAPTITVR